MNYISANYFTSEVEYSPSSTKVSIDMSPVLKIDKQHSAIRGVLQPSLYPPAISTVLEETKKMYKKIKKIGIKNTYTYDEKLKINHFFAFSVALSFFSGYSFGTIGNGGNYFRYGAGIGDFRVPFEANLHVSSLYETVASVKFDTTIASLSEENLRQYMKYLNRNTFDALGTFIYKNVVEE